MEQYNHNQLLTMDHDSKLLDAWQDHTTRSPEPRDRLPNRLGASSSTGEELFPPPWLPEHALHRCWASPSHPWNPFLTFRFFQALNPQDKSRRRTCTGRPSRNLLGTNALKLPPNSYRSEVTNNRIAPKIQTFCSTPRSFCDLRLKDDLNYLEMWTFFRETEDGGF